MLPFIMYHLFHTFYDHNEHNDQQFLYMPVTVVRLYNISGNKMWNNLPCTLIIYFERI